MVGNRVAPELGDMVRKDENDEYIIWGAWIIFSIVEGLLAVMFYQYFIYYILSIMTIIIGLTLTFYWIKVKNHHHRSIMRNCTKQ